MQPAPAPHPQPCPQPTLSRQPHCGPAASLSSQTGLPASATPADRPFITSTPQPCQVPEHPAIPLQGQNWASPHQLPTPCVSPEQDTPTHPTVAWCQQGPRHAAHGKPFLGSSHHHERHPHCSFWDGGLARVHQRGTPAAEGEAEEPPAKPSTARPQPWWDSPPQPGGG